jgi:enamine deaminase RidA (YjgF/YER057c/UK114 family)
MTANRTRCRLLLGPLLWTFAAFPLGAQPPAERSLISSGSKWEDLAGYSRAVVQGDWIFVSGTVGANPDGSIPADFDAQMDNIFAIVADTLEQAEASLADIVRVRCYLVDDQHLDGLAPKLRQYLGDVRPANTTVLARLAVEGALIEIEVTALRRSHGHSRSQTAPTREQR